MICGATFKRQVLLTSHRQKCTWNIESDHSTDVSDEEIPYHDDSDEEIEQEKHSSSLTEVCEECGTVFRRASALAFHQKMNHNKSNDEWSYGYSEEKEVHVKREVINTDEEEFEQIMLVEKVNIKTEDTKASKTECRGDSHHEKKSELNLGKGRTGSGTKEEKIVQSGNTHTKDKNCLSTNPTVEQKEKRVISRTKKPLKEHVCRLCNEIFKSQMDLSSHTKICKLTGSSVKVRRKKNAAKGASFNKNVSEVECENNPKIAEMQYPCKLCGQTFTRSSKLKHHLNMWCKVKNVLNILVMSLCSGCFCSEYIFLNIPFKPGGLHSVVTQDETFLIVQSHSSICKK
ncbi:zinc finger protein 268-like [Penaeus indicus]|uniref:zinc finger protein 268-like n=1 Tax=Penaeus indicus TaxID=29960 RepID=UPI00300D466A